LASRLRIRECLRLEFQSLIVFSAAASGAGGAGAAHGTAAIPQKDHCAMTAERLTND
jgi:hypothetical protein